MRILGELTGRAQDPKFEVDSTQLSKKAPYGAFFTSVLVAVVVAAKYKMANYKMAAYATFQVEYVALQTHKQLL